MGFQAALLVLVVLGVTVESAVESAVEVREETERGKDTRILINLNQSKGFSNVADYLKDFNKKKGTVARIIKRPS